MKMLLFSAMCLVLVGCDFIEKTNPANLEYHDRADGKVNILDKRNKILLVVNSDGRIENILSIDKVLEENEFLKSKGEKTDWASKRVPGSKYTISLSTRFYSGNCLYNLELAPWDDNATSFARSLTLRLEDKDHFELENVQLMNWHTGVDDKGVNQNMNCSGRHSIDLSTYLEIADWSYTFRLK